MNSLHPVTGIEDCWKHFTFDSSQNMLGVCEIEKQRPDKQTTYLVVCVLFTILDWAFRDQNETFPVSRSGQGL